MSNRRRARRREFCSDPAVMLVRVVGDDWQVGACFDHFELALAKARATGRGVEVLTLNDGGGVPGSHEHFLCSFERDEPGPGIPQEHRLSLPTDPRDGDDPTVAEDDEDVA